MSKVFSAYYFLLEATGNPAIDAILEEVAHAGKGSHNTDAWVELGYVERIQRAANVAAGLVQAQKDEQ